MRKIVAEYYQLILNYIIEHSDYYFYKTCADGTVCYDAMNRISKHFRINSFIYKFGIYDKNIPYFKKSYDKNKPYFKKSFEFEFNKFSTNTLCYERLAIIDNYCYLIEFSL